MMELHEAIRKYLEASIKVNDYQVAVQEYKEKLNHRKEALMVSRMELAEAESEMVDIMKKEGIV